MQIYACVVLSALHSAGVMCSGVCLFVHIPCLTITEQRRLTFKQCCSSKREREPPDNLQPNNTVDPKLKSNNQFFTHFIQNTVFVHLHAIPYQIHSSSHRQLWLLLKNSLICCFCVYGPLLVNIVSICFCCHHQIELFFHSPTRLGRLMTW